MQAMIVIVSLLFGMAFFAETGDPHNKETELAAEIIKYETGVDIEKYLDKKN